MKATFLIIAALLVLSTQATRERRQINGGYGFPGPRARADTGPAEYTDDDRAAAAQTYKPRIADPPPYARGGYARAPARAPAPAPYSPPPSRAYGSSSGSAGSSGGGQGGYRGGSPSGISSSGYGSSSNSNSGSNSPNYGSSNYDGGGGGSSSRSGAGSGNSGGSSASNYGRGSTRYQPPADRSYRGDESYDRTAEEEEEENNKPDRLQILLKDSQFTCPKKDGYYADVSLKCEVFHYCVAGAKHSWMCPEGTNFHQVHLNCVPQSHDICKDSGKYSAEVNEYLYKEIDHKGPNNSIRYHQRFYPEEFLGDPLASNVPRTQHFGYEGLPADQQPGARQPQSSRSPPPQGPPPQSRPQSRRPYQPQPQSRPPPRPSPTRPAYNAYESSRGQGSSSGSFGRINDRPRYSVPTPAPRTPPPPQSSYHPPYGGYPTTKPASSRVPVPVPTRTAYRPPSAQSGGPPPQAYKPISSYGSGGGGGGGGGRGRSPSPAPYLTSFNSRPSSSSSSSSSPSSSSSLSGYSPRPGPPPSYRPSSLSSSSYSPPSSSSSSSSYSPSSSSSSSAGGRASPYGGSAGPSPLSYRSLGSSTSSSGGGGGGGSSSGSRRFPAYPPYSPSASSNKARFPIRSYGPPAAGKPYRYEGSAVTYEDEQPY